MDRLLIDFSLDGSGPLTRSLDHASTSGFIRDDAAHWSIEPFIPLHAERLVEYLVGRGELTESQEGLFREFCCDVDKILHERTGSYQTRFSNVYARLDPDSDDRDPWAQRIRQAAKEAEPCGDGLDDVGTDRVGAAEVGAAEVGAADAGAADAGAAEVGAADAGAADAGAAEVGAADAGAADAGDQESESSDRSSAGIAEAVSLCEEILQQAGYRRLRQEDVEGCVGVASQWGVPLHVDFDLFKQLVVYARGDIIGTRLRRRLRKMYRRESVAVPIYQRMVVLFQLHDDDRSEEKLTASALHMRMFKNIPKQDIDMLLPGTRVRISGVDRAKIILPSLGGFLMSIRKIAQYALLFAAIALSWTAILIALVVGYLIKSVLSYFQTKNRYQLNLTKNLYFQKLDTNSGVGHHIIAQAHRQSSIETILAYYALLTSDEPISTRRLRRRCERMIREAIDVEVDFQVDPAIERLLRLEVIAPQGKHWRVCR